MIDETAIPKIEILSQEYKRIWGKELDMVALPGYIDTTKLVAVLNRIVNTGESILVGYEKIYLNK